MSFAAMCTFVTLCTFVTYLRNQNPFGFNYIFEFDYSEDEEGDGWKDEYLEGVLKPVAAVIYSFECGEDSVEEVLKVGVEGGSGDGSIFWFADLGGFEVVFEVGVIGGFPLVLPSDVVGVASGPADFVIF